MKSTGPKAGAALAMASRSAALLPRLPQALTGMLGTGAPIALAGLAGQPGIGVAAALGGMALSSDGGDGETLRGKLLGLIYGMLAGSAAMFTGTRLSSTDWFAFCLPLIAGVVSLIGGLTRALARATTLFVLYAIIATQIGAVGSQIHPWGAALLFFLGSVWTAGVSLSLRPIFRGQNQPGGCIAARQPGYTASQYFRRWRRSLAHLPGWQYVIRITICLAAAQAYNWFWPHHHGLWASLTVVIVVRRDPRAALSRTLHRAAGTAVGVLFTSLLLLGSPPLWSLTALIAVLAAARTVLKEINHAAYTAVMTPLVILLLDFGQAPTLVVIIDRLAATLFGCLAALTLGCLGWSKLIPAEPNRSASRRAEAA